MTTTRQIAERAQRGTLLNGVHTFVINRIHEDTDKKGNPRQILNITTSEGERASIFVTVNSGVTATALIEMMDAYDIDDISELNEAELSASFKSHKGFNNIESFKL